MKQVTAAIIIEDGKILITRRGPNEKLPGYWEFPGGKQEDSESLQECLGRELKEELNVSVIVGEERFRSEYHYSHGSFELIALEATIISGEIELSVHDAAEWVPIIDLDGYKLAPADLPIAKLIQGEFKNANH